MTNGLCLSQKHLWLYGVTIWPAAAAAGWVYVLLYCCFCPGNTLVINGAAISWIWSDSIPFTRRRVQWVILHQKRGKKLLANYLVVFRPTPVCLKNNKVLKKWTEDCGLSTLSFWTLHLYLTFLIQNCSPLCTGDVLPRRRRRREMVVEILYGIQNVWHSGTNPIGIFQTLQ